MKRLFLALNLPDAVKKAMAEFTEKLMKKYQGVNWVNFKNYHITLQFLGDCDETILKGVLEIALSQENKYGEFEFKLGVLGAFPNLKNPRVLFLECAQTNSQKVLGLYKALQFKLANIGIELDNRFWTPHITIGRVKTKINLPADLSFKSDLSFKVNTFELMESILKPGGPEYYVIRSVKL